MGLSKNVFTFYYRKTSACCSVSDLCLIAIILATNIPNAGQHSFLLLLPLSLRAGLQPHGILATPEAPCTLTGQPALTE